MSTALAGVPRGRIAAAIADAAARWCNADFPPRVRAQTRIAERTGYSIPVVEYALDRLFGSITSKAIDATIAREIGGRHTMPVGGVAVVSSRTTIGVAVIPAIFALCAQCDVLVKDREDALVASFFETLAEELDVLAVAARARAWSGASETHDLAAYDAVVAFGADETLRAIRLQLRPDARFIAYGPKASIGYVTREALSNEHAAGRIAIGAARDLVLYDGEGCLSLHALFVERGGRIEPEAFLATLGRAVERASIEFPLGRRDTAVTARVASARDTALFRGGAVCSNAEASFVIEYGSAERPPQFLPRVLAVHAIDGPEEMLAYVQHHRLPLEACALAGLRDDAVHALVEAGANRIARFGEMQAPPLDYAHGGRPRIAEFLRIIGIDNE